QLSNPTVPEGTDVALGEHPTATLTIIDSNPALTVDHIQLIGGKSTIQRIAVVFNHEVSQATAVSTASYGLFARPNESPAGTGKRIPIKIVGADYNASTSTVTL